MTASATDIVAHLGQIPLSERVNCNWGLDEDSTFWEVDDDTYINGILMTIDMDFDIGSLLEIVEKSSSVVSYLAVFEFSVFRSQGPDNFPAWVWDAEWYPNSVGTFSNRSVTYHEVCAWAVEKIYGLRQSWYDRRGTSFEWIFNASVKQD